MYLCMPHAGGDEAELRDMADAEQELCTMLIQLQDHHWRIRSADIEILLKPDGSDYLLGEGAHAKVYSCCNSGCMISASVHFWF